MASAVGLMGSQNVEPRPTPVMVPTVCGAVAMSTNFNPEACSGMFPKRNMKLLSLIAAVAADGCSTPLSSGGVTKGWPPQRTTQKFRRR